MRKALRIVRLLVSAIAVLLSGALVLLQVPKVQTALAGRLLSSLEERLGGSVEVSAISLRPLNAVVVKDLIVLDSAPPTKDGATVDTLFKAGTVVATFSIKGLAKKEGLHFSRVRVRDGALTLTSEEGGSNLKRFLNSPGRKEKKEQGDIFEIGKVRIEGFRFKLLNLKKPPKETTGIDWGDLDVFVSELEAKDLGFSQGYMSGFLKSLSARERSGYTIDDLSGRVKVGHGRTVIEGMVLHDAWSDLDIPLFTMSYANPKSFKNFVSEVGMELRMVESELSFKSLSFFAPVFRDKDILISVKEAQADGTVDELRVGRLLFSEMESGTGGEVGCSISSTTKGPMMRIDSRIIGLTLTTEGMERLLAKVSPGLETGLGKLGLRKFASGETLVLDAVGKGQLDRLEIEGSLTSEGLGAFETDLEVLNLTRKDEAIEIGGSFATRSLDIGKLAGLEQLGECTMRGALGARFEKEERSLSIDTLFVDKLSALGYSYSNIAAAGTYSQNAFNGRVICNDPNLSFLFQGILTFSDKTQNRLYKFYANVGYADLQALNLDKRGGVSKVSGQVNANYMSINRGDIIGSIGLKRIVLENEAGRHSIGDISVESHSNNSIDRMNLSSSFATASFVGSKPLTTLTRALDELTLQRELPALAGKKTSGWNDDEYEIKVDFHDARDLLSFVLPGLYIAEKTRVRLNVHKDGMVEASVNSPRLALGKNYLKDFSLKVDNKDGSLNGLISSGETSAPMVDLLDNRIAMSARNNHIDASFSYDNGGPHADKGEILLAGDLDRGRNGDLLVSGKTLPSSVFYNDEAWRISSSSIGLKDGGIKVDGLTATCGEQAIRLDGGFSSSAKDTLTLELARFDIGLLNRFLKQDFGIGGKSTGRALLTSPLKGNAGLMMSLKCDSTVVAGRRAGRLMLASTLDEKNKMRVIVRNDLDGERTIDISGDIDTQSRKLDFEAGLNGMDVGYLSPLLSSVFSEMGGRMSGKVRVGGSIASPHLSSEGARFDNALLRVGFTKVPYIVDGPFTVSDQGLSFDEVDVSDRQGGKGTVSGGLFFTDGLKSPRMDTRISIRDIECLDTGESDNPSFYGRIFAGGDVRISGPLNAILLDINATTTKEGDIHIPLDNTSKDRTGDLLSFKTPSVPTIIDPYDLMMDKLERTKRGSNDFGVRIRVNAGPQVRAFVELDKTAGNVLSGRGRGQLDINVRPGRDIFTINGDYTLDDGNFHFNAMNIAQRDFTLREGSSIRFNGDIMDSDLSIDGAYSTKASVATLISDTTSTSSRRLVNCGIGISGKLREPDLDFSIEVPDLDPTTKSKVESALNTDDKVQRQFLTLLISGNFMPEEQSGVVNNTNALYNNVAEIMAGQLNNILQKLDIPLDLGLNYQSKESGSDIFDVAVSTKLFNDRVLVNGALGNREYGTSSSSRDVAGDIDIEIKLDKPGQVRLNLFSHSADSYTSYLDNTQRSGVGLTFQKEFNTLREFLRGLFSGKKKRGEQQNTGGTANERETRTISINEYEN